MGEPLRPDRPSSNDLEMLPTADEEKEDHRLAPGSGN
jgi:hypothetical protein